MKLSISSLIALAHVIPGLLAVPMPTRESCTCQPLPPFTRHPETYNSSLASCTRIARDIERWRWPLHSPKLADAFVDVSPLELRAPSKGYSSPVSKPGQDPPRGTTVEKHHAFKHSEGMSKSRGTYIESQQRFRILCHPRPPTIEPYAPNLMQSWLAIFIAMTLIWLFIFEILVKVWLRYGATL